MILAFVAVLTLIASPAAARCGKERWSVKTGTDAGAAGIDILHPTPTTIAALSAFAPPNSHSIPLDRRISPAEVTAWTVQATLVEFKFEDSPTTGDSDYHLVLRDSQGNTLIAEIPSPGCVGSSSAFAGGIRHARQEIDSRFTASSSFQPVNLPVEVTGVGMFDFPHGQRGHAANFIELHPVLEVNFNPGALAPVPTPTPTPSPSPTPPPTPGPEMIKDGGFEAATESGNSAPGWTATTTASQPVIVTHGSYPHEGNNYAFLGGFNNVNATLEQDLSVPSGSANPTLRFWVNVVTTETSTAGARDRLAVEIRDSSGALLATPLTLDNRDARRANNTRGQYFRPHAIAMTRFAGQQIRLVFHVTTDRARPTTFRLDDVSLASSP